MQVIGGFLYFGSYKIGEKQYAGIGYTPGKINFGFGMQAGVGYE
ncbi:MAG: hypothetical protein ABIL49_02910 [candidate division WOR-3 bacterium]|jgi:hypothetical protein